MNRLNGGVRRPPVRTFGISFVSALFVITLQFVVFPPPAQATTCTLISGILTVNPESADVTISRDATQLKANDIFCGLLTNIETVHINMQSDHKLTFDLSNGVLGPGVTNEGDGSSEIEFDVTNPSLSSNLVVMGGSGADLVTVGRRTLAGPEAVTALNLNGVQDGFSADEDVIAHSARVPVALSGAGGGDFLGGHGTGVVGSSPTKGAMQISDGPGADQVLGGDGRDLIFPQDSPDEGDQYSGGAGKDLLSFFLRSVPMTIT
jgi:hypothetical protein